jgi:hypothetical protein
MSTDRDFTQNNAMRFHKLKVRLAHCFSGTLHAFRLLNWYFLQVPKQQNNYDCGVFVIKYTEVIFMAAENSTQRVTAEICQRAFEDYAFTQVLDAHYRRNKR